jgi:hypothetical protein
MGVLRHSIARALFLPLPLFALVACGITLPEGLTDGDAATPADVRVPEVDATAEDSGAVDTGIADDATTSDAAVDAEPSDSGFDAGPPDTGPVDSGPPPVPCSDADNEKQVVLDAALARCNGLTNPTYLNVGFAPQFAVGTYCETPTKRVVLCLFQPATPVSAMLLDPHCSNAKIQEGATTFAGSTYYRYVSGANGSKTSDPDLAVRRLSGATSGVSRWARQSGNGQFISLDKDGKVESPTPDKNSFLQMAACNFALK